VQLVEGFYGRRPLQIVKATTAKVRKQKGKEDTSRCCKGGDSARRFQFGGLSASCSLHAREWGSSRSLMQTCKSSKC